MVSFSLINAIDPTTIIFVVLLALLIIALLVVPMFTNKKRAKQTDELHRSLQPGDKIKTIGGIVGTIIEIRQVSPVDKEMVIETGVGDNKTTMVFDIQALYQIMSRSSTVVPAMNEKDAVEDPMADLPSREVPDIMADRKVEPAEQPYAEQEAVESEKADAVESEQPAEAEQAAAELETEQKSATKKPSANNGAKKSSGSSNKSKKK